MTAILASPPPVHENAFHTGAAGAAALWEAFRGGHRILAPPAEGQ